MSLQLQSLKNTPGGRSQTVLGETDALAAQKSDCIIVLAGTNGGTKSFKTLNIVKKMEKKVKNHLRNTRLMFKTPV